jgi:hypothetical protein
MRFWRAFDLGAAADGVKGVRGEDAAPPVLTDGDGPRSWKYEVAIVDGIAFPESFNWAVRIIIFDVQYADSSVTTL